MNEEETSRWISFIKIYERTSRPFQTQIFLTLKIYLGLFQTTAEGVSDMNALLLSISTTDSLS